MFGHLRELACLPVRSLVGRVAVEFGQLARHDRSEDGDAR